MAAARGSRSSSSLLDNKSKRGRKAKDWIAVVADDLVSDPSFAIRTHTLNQAKHLCLLSVYRSVYRTTTTLRDPRKGGNLFRSKRRA
jgi:hypothetical protein